LLKKRNVGLAEFFFLRKKSFLPWRRDVVVIVSANGTEDRGFESCQGMRFTGIYAMLLLVT
jgi:hypothetical protein